jgi:hypothetical protein
MTIIDQIIGGRVVIFEPTRPPYGANLRSRSSRKRSGGRCESLAMA